MSSPRLCALADVGYCEKKSAKKLYSKTANRGSNNYTKFQKILGVSNGNPWCAWAVQVWFRQAYGKKIANKVMYQSSVSGYVPTIYNNFKKKKRITSKPKVGDVVFFQGNCHIGIVYKVKGNTIKTIEGNTSGSVDTNDGGEVAIKTYNYKSSSWVKDFGRPRYELIKSAKKTTKTTTKTNSTTVDVSDFPTLNVGDKNKKYVTKLRTQLKKKKYGHIKVLKFTKYTKALCKVVKQFQKKNGLVADGVVGQNTWEKLYK